MARVEHIRAWRSHGVGLVAILVQVAQLDRDDNDCRLGKSRLSGVSSGLYICR